MTTGKPVNALGIAALVVASAAGTASAQSVRTVTSKDAQGTYTWDYCYVVPADKSVEVSLQLPAPSDAPVLATPFLQAGKATGPGRWIFSADDVKKFAADDTVKSVCGASTGLILITVRAHESVIVSDELEWTWCSLEADQACKADALRRGTASGPAAREDASSPWVPVPVVGVGASVRAKGNAFDVEMAGNVIRTVKDIGSQPTFFVGIEAPLFRVKTRGPVSALVTVQFAGESSRAVDGVFIGASFRFTRFLSLALGVSLDRSNEIPPEVRRAAAELIVADLPESERDAFRQNQMKDGELKNRSLYQGFNMTRLPSHLQGLSAIPGNDAAFHVCVVLPIRFQSLLGAR